MGELAQKQLPQSVSAFRELRQIMDSAAEQESSKTDTSALSLSVIRMLQEAAGRTDD